MNQASFESRDNRDRADANGDAYGMKAKAKTTSRKLGDDRNETANKARPRDKNFKQSRDIHEDRGTRQMKTGTVPRPSQGK
jgi:hypothetical protein